VPAAADEADSRIVSAAKACKSQGMHSPVRLSSALLLVLGLVSPAMAQTGATAPAPAEKSAASEAETKLAVVLRSYSLLEAETDVVKDTNAKLTAEKAALEAKLAEAQGAIPLAAETVALREQLRQVQGQLAAYAEENASLKSRMALIASLPVRTTGNFTPTAPAPVAPPPAPPPPPPKPAPRSHVIAPGDTLLKISQTYYGTPNRWNEILAANRDALRDEKSLVIGRTLVIP
jgi:nucleoid-associated protein YgaU